MDGLNKKMLDQLIKTLGSMKQMKSQLEDDKNMILAAGLNKRIIEIESLIKEVR